MQQQQLMEKVAETSSKKYTNSFKHRVWRRHYITDVYSMIKFIM